MIFPQKKIASIICCILIFCCTRAQTTLSAAQIKTTRGTVIPFSTAVQKDSLVLVCFWATTSDVSINELNAINAKYEKWKQALSFKLMAVAVDEGKLANRVKALANMNDWKFDVYTDINGELRAALHSGNLPQSLILKNNQVIYELSGYEPGTEDYLYRKLREIAPKK